MLNLKSKAITFIFVLSLITVFFCTCALEARSGKIETDKSIGLENDFLSVQFDKTSGSLISIVNLITGDEYIKDKGLDGNPFRVYVDTTQLPKTATVRFPWPEQPLENDMGGKIVDAKNCKLSVSSYEKTGKSTTLNLHLIDNKTALQFIVKVSLPDNEKWFDMDLTVQNQGGENHRIMTSFPYLTGLGLGSDRSTNLGIGYSKPFGTSGLPGWDNVSGIYGQRWNMQWNAVYDLKTDEVFGYIVKDPNIENKIFRRFGGGGMCTLYFPDNALKAGEKISYPQIRIYAYKGSWKELARDYGKWFSENFEVRRSPKWMDDVETYWGRWVPSVESVAKAKTLPDGPGVFASYENLPRLYVNGHTDLMEWAMFANGTLKPDDGYSGLGPDGMNVARSDLGGVVALRKGIEKLHKIGRRATIYVGFFSARSDSDLYKGTRLEDWMLMDAPGQHWVIDVKNAIQNCPGYQPWQDHLAQMCKRLIWETGADGLRLDQFGQYNPCYNPAHHHQSPFDSNKWITAALGKIRTAIDEVNPDTVLWVEGISGDYIHQFIDASLLMGAHYPGRELAPLTVALPSFQGVGYDFGAIEAALNGVPTECFKVCRRSGWSAYHIKHPRPEGYPEPQNDYETYWGPGLGRNVRWHELRPTFIEAMDAKDATDIDPVAIDCPQWWGRLWRAEKYWVMTGGMDNGTKPAKPIKVKLPELPENITIACEIDTETLDIEEAKLERTKDGIFVTVANGFSAVLFPKPDCPAIVKMERPQALEQGKPKEIALTLFSPWRKSLSKASVKVDVPGLELNSKEIRLPGKVIVTAPAGSEPGYYYIKVTGDCLPLRRWIVNSFVPPHIPFDDSVYHKLPLPFTTLSDSYLP